MIRIQIYCHSCRQFLDTTVVARKGRALVAAYEDSHALEACYEEVLHGQEEASSGGSGEADTSTVGEGQAEGSDEASGAGRERTH